MQKLLRNSVPGTDIKGINSQAGKSAQGHLFEIRAAAHLTEGGNIITDMSRLDNFHIDQVTISRAYQAKRSHESLLWIGGFPASPDEIDYDRIREYLNEAIGKAKKEGLSDYRLAFPDFVPGIIDSQHPQLKKVLTDVCFDGKPCAGRSLWDRLVSIPDFMTSAEVKRMHWGEVVYQ